ncbi:restriction endonuclease subunit S [Vagococcus fluvialis]|uniref:restriction endonuclease subunit S n=1 Tax=Vagococcus fluvialis TaxID=2738 RepID=UPI003B5A3ACC
MEYKEYLIKDIIRLNYGKSLPKAKRNEGEFPVYGSGGITGYHNEFLVEGPSIIVGRKGTVGSLFYEERSFFPIDTTYYVLPSSKYDLKYLYYLFQTIGLDKMNTHSAVPGLNRDGVYAKKIMLPSIFYQKKVSHFISLLERKIELNNQMIDTLEEMASTLFKRWFVDFEFPDENGNPYKSSGGKMIDSELGEIPEGWEIGNLSDVSEIIMGQSPKSNTYNQSKEGLPLVNGASDFKQGYINPLKYTTDPKKITKSGDYIFGVRATIGNVTYVDSEYAIGRGAGIARVREVYFSEYLYTTLNALFDYFTKIATGSVYINISKKDFEKYQIVIPSIFYLKKYHNTVGSLFYKIRKLREENLSLSQIRDELLPRLLSGEIEL